MSALNGMQWRVVSIAVGLLVVAVVFPGSSAFAQYVESAAVESSAWLPEPMVVEAAAGKAVCRAFDAKSVASFADQAVYSINLSRAEAGLPPLKRTAALDAAAADHSTRMGEHDFVGHCDVLQQTWPAQRAASQGYSASAVGESIAAGLLDPTSLVTTLMASPGHQAVLLSPDFREIGMGHFYDDLDNASVWRDLDHDCDADTFTNGPYYNYWTIIPATRTATYYPVVINLEQPATGDLDVQLYLYGEGWAQEMRIRNHDGAWPEWQPFASNVEWQLSLGATDECEVFVEIRNGAEVHTSSDTIRYLIDIFSDGFESGNLAAWSEVAP